MYRRKTARKLSGEFESRKREVEEKLRDFEDYLWDCVEEKTKDVHLPPWHYAQRRAKWDSIDEYVQSILDGYRRGGAEGAIEEAWIVNPMTNAELGHSSLVKEVVMYLWEEIPIRDKNWYLREWPWLEDELRK